MRASGSSVNPPGSSPELPTTTDRASRSTGAPPSMLIVNLAGGSGEVDRPGHRVGEPAEVVLEPGRRHDRRVEAHARHRGERRPVGSGQVDPAVRAAGAAGAQRRRRARPWRAPGCPASRRAGCRCRPGRSRAGCPYCARPSAHPRTVPSPPTATTRSAPSAAASLAAATPASALPVTWNSGVHPARAAAAWHSGRNRPPALASVPLITNATAAITSSRLPAKCHYAPPPGRRERRRRRSRRLGRLPRGCGPPERAPQTPLRAPQTLHDREGFYYDEDLMHLRAIFLRQGKILRDHRPKCPIPS